LGADANGVGTDNCLVGFRVVGHGNGFRIENRMPGSLRDAEVFANSRLTRTAFGEGVVEFYVHHARLEIEAFNQAVTDWKEARYFERI